MWLGFPLHPEQASSMAGNVDQLLDFLMAVSIFFTVLIFATVFFFVVRYRRSRQAKAEQIHGNLPLEILWSVIPFGLTIIMFVWGASLFIRNSRPPRNSTEVYVVGKQWMWKLQHPEGPREINELHVPVNEPVKLTMTSVDVIHDFYIPAFRIQKDVVPGMYTTLWLKANRVGRYHFFCNQFCGTNHALMGGWVDVMSRSDYEKWLSGGVQDKPMSEGGAQLYSQYGCITCHGAGKAPSLTGLYMTQVKLDNGQTVVADDAYLRESILYPSAKIVAGYNPIMPTFQGQITEEQLLQILAYIKSLAPQQPSKGVK